jgi:nucleoside-diphosphate-sugar epimerase
MNILVTGGAGYLGSVLVPKLLVRGHKVRTLDIGYFGVEHIRAMRPAVEILRDDIRTVLGHQKDNERPCAITSARCCPRAVPPTHSSRAWTWSSTWPPSRTTRARS